MVLCCSVLDVFFFFFFLGVRHLKEHFLPLFMASACWTCFGVNHRHRSRCDLVKLVPERERAVMGYVVGGKSLEEMAKERVRLGPEGRALSDGRADDHFTSPWLQSAEDLL